MLTDEQKAVLHYAIDNGIDSIETEGFLGNGDWMRFMSAKFTDVMDGKLGIRIKQTPDSIDWTHVSTDIYCMARDAGGNCFGYLSEPEQLTNTWKTCRYINGLNMLGFASYKRGTVDWKESLVLNPFYKEKKNGI